MITDPLPLGIWAPDRRSINAGVLSIAENVQPSIDGYAPFPMINQIGTALPSENRGMFTAFSDSDPPIYFAGTSSRLYKYNFNTQSWSDISPVGAPFALNIREMWSFTQFGRNVIACAASAGMFKFDVVTGTQFLPVGGSPPASRYVEVVGDFLVAGANGPGERQVAWSGINNIDVWTPGTLLSGRQEFADGGLVRGVAGGEFGVIFQQQKIRRMVFAPGTPEVFQFSVVENGRGCSAPYAIARAGAQIFFFDGNGFFVLQEGESRPIAREICDAWFLKATSSDQQRRMTASPSWRGQQVFFACASSLYSPAIVMIYDYKLDRWSYLRGDFPVVSRFSPIAIIPDNMSNSFDDLTVSLDSDAFVSGALTTVFGSSAGRIGYPSGLPMDARMVTGVSQLARPGRAQINGICLETDAGSYLASVEGGEQIFDPAALTFPAGYPADAQSFAHARRNARYHAADFRITGANGPWAYASSIQIDYQRRGMR